MIEITGNKINTKKTLNKFVVPKKQFNLANNLQVLMYHVLQVKNQCI
jgi:hypothetical protein